MKGEATTREAATREIMMRITTVLLASVVCMGFGWAAYQATAAPEPPLPGYAPAGALLYLQAKDFSSLLADWNGSAQKQQWLQSSNYEVFSWSRLLLRLKDAGRQFSTAAGLPPDMNFLTQMAGKQTAFALYDIGKLQFLYVTRLPSASAMQSQLWQTRAQFETRTVGGATFYLRRDPESEREVEFAVSGDYLLLATREDLMAGALQLMGGSKGRPLDAEAWWTQSVSAAGPSGDLRMVLNLEKIVPSPYFRSYWIQQNVTDMKQYSAAVSDLFRSRQEYREERVLIKKTQTTAEAPPVGGSGQPTALVPARGVEATADLLRLVPESAGVYEGKAYPSPDSCLELLASRILAPHMGPAPAGQLAPQVQLTSGETGATSDLETRIDQAPVSFANDAGGSSQLKEILKKNQVVAALQIESTERDTAGVFVRIHSAVALAGSSDWDEATVRAALVAFLRPSLTASQLGVGWRPASGYYEMDGLHPLMAAVRGKNLIVSNDSGLISGLLANLTGANPNLESANRKMDSPLAVFIAGFNHSREKENFAGLTRVVDRPEVNGGNPGADRQPQFFSENVASLSATLAAVSSEKIVVRDAGDKVLQTVTYQWSQ
jgi:hypothetical protein